MSTACRLAKRSASRPVFLGLRVPGTAAHNQRVAVGRTGLDGRPVPVEPGDPAAPPLRLMVGQLIEPFQAQR